MTTRVHKSLHFKIAIVTLAVLVNQQTALAQKKAAPAKKGAQTVGDLLNSIENKDSTALPTSVDTFATDRTKKTNVNLNVVSPPKTTEIFQQESGDRGELERITDQQISEMYTMTQRFKNSPNRGELWLRLAELYVEKANLLNAKKQELFDQQLKLYNEGKIKVRPQFESRDAKEYNRKAVQLYEWFQRDFPKDEKMDQALFFLGFNNFELGETTKGVAYYNKLVKEYPNSKLVTESYFSLGEFYFENEKWNDAQKYFSEVMKTRSHRLFPFALYKNAWCLFRTGQQEKALKSLEILIKMSRMDGNKGKHKLESEGLRDIVLFYSEVGRIETAAQYFRDLAGNEYLNYLEKLAYFYSDKGEKDKALYLFKELIRNGPTAPKAFEYQYQIILSFSHSKDTDKFRNELYNWVKEFGANSEWYKVNKGNAEFIENSFKLRELTLRNYVLQNHQTAQNSRAPFSQKLAYEGYKLYLAECVASPNYPDMRFYFGELLYDMKLYAESLEQYKWVATSAPATNKFIAKSYLNAVLSSEKALPTDAALAKKVGNSTAPIPFDINVDNFLKTAQWYLAKYPESDKTVEIKFRMGKLYYQHNQFDPAVTIFKEIVQKYPKTQYAEYSANLILDIFNLKKDYAAIEKNGAELLALPAFASSKAGAEIREVMEKAGFKRAQDLEGTKDYAKSASQFEAFAKGNPGSSLAATALFNAAINYEKAGLLPKSINAHKSFLETNDKTQFANKLKSIKILAKIYQDAGQLDESARLYLQGAKAASGDAGQASLYFNAAILFEALNRVDEAVESYSQYNRSEKDPEGRADTIYKIAMLYKDNNRMSQCLATLKEYLKLNPRDGEKVMEAHNILFTTYLAAGQQGEAESWKQKMVAMQKRYSPDKKGIGAGFVAKLRLQDGERKYESLKAIQIPSDPAQQQAAAQKKIGIIGEINTILVDVIKFDSADEIVGALTVLGLANAHMADVLINAPLPAGLTEAETKEYKDGIAKFAEPFTKKSSDSFRAAVDKARDFEVYNSYYVIALRNLARLEPKLAYEGGELAIDTKIYDWMGVQ